MRSKIQQTVLAFSNHGNRFLATLERLSQGMADQPRRFPPPWNIRDALRKWSYLNERTARDGYV